MGEPLRTILLLAERLGVHDDGRSIGSFLDRLEAQGVAARVLCVEAASDAAADPRVVECPGLSSRWRLPWLVRNLRFGERFERPNLLHVLEASMSDAGLAIAEHWGIPYILTVEEFLKPGGRIRLSRSWCRGLVATSHELAEDLRRNMNIPGAMLAEIHSGIEAPAEGPSRSSEQRRVPVVGTAGPLVATSGLATFLNAARRVIQAGVDAEFVIAGQGEDEVDLRRRADRLKIADRVTFAGIPVVGLRFWNVLDIYCQPSLVPTVGRPLATALAFGIPAIASDIEGLRVLVEPGVHGLRVAPGDSGELAQAILSLLADPARAAEFGHAGRALILREFDPGFEAAHLTKLYAGVLATPTSSTRDTLVPA